MKKTIAAAAVAMFCAPAFAQTTLTASQCIDAGGVIQNATCVISEADLANYLNSGGATGSTGAATTAGLGGGLGAGGAAIIGLVVVAAAAGGGGSSTTTTN